MAKHRFEVGDQVQLIPKLFSPREAEGWCTVTRLLPNDQADREYRVRYGKDGPERVVRESEMRAGTVDGWGRKVPGG